MLPKQDGEKINNCFQAETLAKPSHPRKGMAFFSPFLLSPRKPISRLLFGIFIAPRYLLLFFVDALKKREYL